MGKQNPWLILTNWHKKQSIFNGLERQTDPHPPNCIWDSAYSALHNDPHENSPDFFISGQSKVDLAKPTPLLFKWDSTPRGVYIF